MGGYWVHNTSELLACLCAAGVFAALFRWRGAVRHDFLLSFMLFLAGTLVREIVVWRYGVADWPEVALHWSAFGRLVQVVGGVLFVRASMRDTCGEWGWIVVLAAATLVAAVV